MHAVHIRSKPGNTVKTNSVLKFLLLCLLVKTAALPRTGLCIQRERKEKGQRNCGKSSLAFHQGFSGSLGILKKPRRLDRRGFVISLNHIAAVHGIDVHHFSYVRTLEERNHSDTLMATSKGVCRMDVGVARETKGSRIGFAGDYCRCKLTDLTHPHALVTRRKLVCAVHFSIAAYTKVRRIRSTVHNRTRCVASITRLRHTIPDIEFSSRRKTLSFEFRSNLNPTSPQTPTGAAVPLSRKMRERQLFFQAKKRATSRRQHEGSRDGGEKKNLRQLEAL